MLKIPRSFSRIYNRKTSHGKLLVIVSSVSNAMFILQQEKGRPLPKFGEWDVNDPASAEGFTVIFNKARDEKKTGGTTRIPGVPAESPAKDDDAYKNHGSYPQKSSTRKWLCCMQPSAVES